MGLTDEQKYMIEVASPVVSNAQQNKYAKQAFERNKEFYWEQWNANNAYNSPVQQRARLEEGGFNPALMYNDSGSTGNATMSKGPEQDTPQVTPFTGGLAYSQIQLMRSQMEREESVADLNSVESALKVQQTATEKLKGELTSAQAEYWQKQADNAQKIIDMQLKKDQASVDSAEQSIKLSKAQEQKVYQDIVNQTAVTQAQVKQYEASVSKIQKELEKMNVDIDMTKALTNKTQAEELKTYLEAMVADKKRMGFGGEGHLGDIYNAIWVLGNVADEAIGNDNTSQIWIENRMQERINKQK